MDQDIKNRSGNVNPIDKVMAPLRATMQQSSTAPGTNLKWLPWLMGVIALSGGLALYLLTRKKIRGQGASHKPAGAWKEEKPGYEETMKRVRESLIISREPNVADIAKNLNLPLSGDALKGLNMLIDRGAFKNKSEFISYLTKTYMRNDVGSMMSEGIEPHPTRVIDIIHKSGIAKNLFDSDIKKYLVPLFLAGFKAIHDHTSLVVT